MLDTGMCKGYYQDFVLTQMLKGGIIAYRVKYSDLRLVAGFCAA
jgi:hypothetical protein